MKKPQWMVMANAMGIGVRTYNETSVTWSYPDCGWESCPRKAAGSRRMVHIWLYGIERTMVNPSTREIGKACRKLLVEAAKTGRITE